MDKINFYLFEEIISHIRFNIIDYINIMDVSKLFRKNCLIIYNKNNITGFYMVRVIFYYLKDRKKKKDSQLFYYFNTDLKYYIMKIEEKENLKNIEIIYTYFENKTRLVSSITKTYNMKKNKDRLNINSKLGVNLSLINKKL